MGERDACSITGSWLHVAGLPIRPGRVAFTSSRDDWEARRRLARISRRTPSPRGHVSRSPEASPRPGPPRLKTRLLCDERKLLNFKLALFPLQHV
jgi:hypothetical protein